MLPAAGTAGEETPPGLRAPRPGSARASAAGWKLQAPSGQATRGRAQCHPHPRLAQLPRSNAIHTEMPSRPRWPASPLDPQAGRVAGTGSAGSALGHFRAHFPRTAPAPASRTQDCAPPRVALPRSVCSLAPATANRKQKNFSQTFLSGHFAGFLKSLAPSSQNLHSIQ